jgi:membrane protein
MGYLKAIVRSFIDFFKDGGLMLAGSLSYFFMMSMIPFCLILAAILGYFLEGHQELVKFFTDRLISFFPSITHEITDEFTKLIWYKGLGQFSLVIYALLSYQFFSALESSLTAVFKVKNKRHFTVSLILSLVIITLIIAFILISFGATTAISMLKTLREFFPGLKIGKITGFLIKYIVPLILITLTLAAVYIILPRRKVRVVHAWWGAFFTAILLEAAKHLFTIYVVQVAQLGSIYGPLSVFIFFLLWVYYSSCIFLIGGELVHNLETKKGKG